MVAKRRVRLDEVAAALNGRGGPVNRRNAAGFPPVRATDYAINSTAAADIGTRATARGWAAASRTAGGTTAPSHWRTAARSWARIAALSHWRTAATARSWDAAPKTTIEATFAVKPAFAMVPARQPIGLPHP
jgi:hypothetical protein